MSDLIGNPNCWFCHAKAQTLCVLKRTTGVNKFNNNNKVYTSLSSRSKYTINEFLVQRNVTIA